MSKHEHVQIEVHKPFTLRWADEKLGVQEQSFGVGVHEVPPHVADHGYTQAHAKRVIPLSKKPAALEDDATEHKHEETADDTPLTGEGSDTEKAEKEQEKSAQPQRRASGGKRR